tara:strand:- start:315 stop:623 length:309 start_codon:yes stop_codon:yes gene_type:complete
MDLADLISILELTTHCKIKARAIISDNNNLDDDMLDKACHYYLSLRTTIDIVEKIVSYMDEEVVYEIDELSNITLVTSLYLSIKQSSKLEDLLTSRMSIVSH